MSNASPRSQLPRRPVSTVSGNTTDTAATLAAGSNPDNARRRQTKRDEAIRKKAEQELSRKLSSPKNRHHHQRTKRVPGTVSSLQPSAALTVRQTMTIMEAAQLMAAKRADSVLVVDNDEHLAGIFTAKDVAYRVVAEGMDARGTLVAHIMTKSPLCVTTDTNATDALNTMVTRGFRHLPVCNDEGDVVGLLDVIKCMYEALDKMERAYGSSRKLYDALEGVEREWSVNSGSLMQFVDALRERMACPDLTSVLREVDPVMVSPRTSVRDVARQMRSKRTTAALIIEETGRMAGIFTSKDVVLRVIAANLDPANCSVVRVMTPHPDTALPTTTILDALKRMHENHYLNLPVVSEAGDVMGIVDVLSLCYSTLETMKSIQSQDAEGPVWGRFFGMAHGPDDENASLYSDSMANSVHQQSSFHLASDVYPHDSVSVAEDIASAVNSRIGDESHVASTALGGMVAAALEDGQYVFKFKSPTGKVHRFTASYQDTAGLHTIVTAKLTLDGVADPTELLHSAGLCYLDDENDYVLLSSDNDLLDAVRIAQAHQWPRIMLALNPEALAEHNQAEEAAAAASREAASANRSVVGTATGSVVGAEGLPPSGTASQHAVSRTASNRSLLATEQSQEPTDEPRSHAKRGRGSSGAPIPEQWIIPAAVASGFLAALVGVVIILKATK
ncbi:hypothetical protein H4R34_002059 [Dimargaris verticillata]|uniref:CBS domain-containing protein n=1 Tax=Dimargaris verticillata TaxID=2761393 RepID=A0A9W8B8S3_9FUNG|nr:hypothetical protein H4R34_002059 [Dimargaris verticillata]